MKKVYYSASITGSKGVSEDFQMNLVEHMKSLGFKVLSEHVAIQDSKILFTKMSENAGINIPKRDGYEREIRETDIKWVEEADYFVGVVDGPSLGVGIEIEHALLRSRLGLPPCKILCLVQNDNFANLSAMVKGVRSDYFKLEKYMNENEAKDIIKLFLLQDAESSSA